MTKETEKKPEEGTVKKEAPVANVSARIMEKVTTLKKLETQLGHLPPDEWTMEELKKRTQDPHFSTQAKQLESQTELLFAEICEEMTETNKTPSEICELINANLKYPGGPKYCNEAEVKESLGLED